MKRRTNREYSGLDSEYSLGSKVVNTSLGALALTKVPGVSSWAKNKIKKRATGYAMSKAASGAAGIIGAKTGVDKESVKQAIDGVGQLTGATSYIKKGVSSGKFQEGITSTADSIKEKAKLTRLKAQNAVGLLTRSTNTSSNG